MKSNQLEFIGTSGWGKRRKGAGRPNRSGTVNHMSRQMVQKRYPMHITMRLKDRLPNLRTGAILRKFRLGIRAARDRGLKVNHFSLLNNHIHMIVERVEGDRYLSAGF